MPQSSETLKLKRTINVPPAEVYRAFIHAVALRDWLADAAQTDPHEGGHLYLWWNGGYFVNGEYMTLVPAQKIAFTWLGRDEPEPTRVQVTFAEKESATLVTLAHSGLGTGKKWIVAREGIVRGWETGLENLQAVLETGIDLRQARLPRLGILIGDFNAEIAGKLRVPVTYGARLEGTVEGTGAHAVGLQKDDVIVRLAGKKIADYSSFGGALRAHHAGDKVPVVFYRDGEKKRVMLELSARPLPEVLPLADLVQAARKNYAEVNALLAKLLESVSEAEAEYRPAPEEWNAKEIIAHFIACDRDLQSWIADMVHDNLVGDSLEYRPNVTPRLRTIVARFATLPALQKELECAENETLEFVAALPPEFVARKHLYLRVASWLTQVVPTHLSEEHGEQLRATIQSAREKKAF